MRTFEEIVDDIEQISQDSTLNASEILTKLEEAIKELEQIKLDENGISIN